jgi:hypothetical protein
MRRFARAGPKQGSRAHNFLSTHTHDGTDQGDGGRAPASV